MSVRRNLITTLTAILVALCAGAASANELDDAVGNYKTLKGERHDSVYVLKIYNPPTNLMTAPMVAELRDFMAKADADESVRVIVVTGGVPNYFIQHYDVAELDSAAGAISAGQTVSSSTELHATHKLYLEIERLSKPVIAAINGQAHGGGFEMTLACDFRIMTKPGSVGLPEANIGILPGAGGTVRLPRLIGVSRAKELMMQGLTADAATAERYGLVMKAVPPDALMDEAMRVANRLASLPPLSLKHIKSIVNETATMPLEKALRYEEDRFWETMGSKDAIRLMREYVEGNQKGL